MNIATRIYNRLIFAYSCSPCFDFVSRRFKNQINENCKAFASAQNFPEMVHNEIEGWSYPAKILSRAMAVMFRDNTVHPRINKKVELSKIVLAEKGVAAVDVWAQGDTLLSKITSLVYIADYISFYLAVLYGVDTSTIDSISRIKKEK